MKTSDFYYDLPQELIAQDPLEDRSSSRLMHLSLKDGSIEHRHFTDVLDYMEEGDCLVINDTKVIPARLYGHKEETGALIEILLLKRRENDIWECLVKPGKKARPGAKITFGNGILKGKIIDEAIGLSAVIINETVGDKINKANAAINYLNDLNAAYDENNENVQNNAEIDEAKDRLTETDFTCQDMIEDANYFGMDMEITRVGDTYICENITMDVEKVTKVVDAYNAQAEPKKQVSIDDLEDYARGAGDKNQREDDESYKDLCRRVSNYIDYVIEN